MKTYTKCKICNKYSCDYYKSVCHECIQNIGDVKIFELLDWYRELITEYHNINNTNNERKKDGRKAYSIYKIYLKYLQLYYNRLGVN